MRGSGGTPRVQHMLIASTPAGRARSLRAAAGRLAWRAGAWLWWCVPCVLGGLGAAVPVLESTAAAVGAGWMPAGDDGIIATRGHDVLTSHTPLVGQYSEAGLVIHGQVMHSPGPMLYWLLALPARYGSVASLAVTMGVLNTLCIVGCVLLARRRGGLPLMLAVGVGIAAMCQSLPSESFHDIWNPAAALFPFLLLVFLGWSLACGQHRLLPLTALVASYVIQTHLMYFAPSLVVLAVGLGGLALRRLPALPRRLPLRRRAAAQPALPVTREEIPTAPEEPAPAVPVKRRWVRGHLWPWALTGLVIAAGCWTPPVMQQLETNPGNLTMIVRTAEHRGHALGASVGWNAVVEAIGVRPWWLHVPASEWQRKREVLKAPGALAENSALAMLAALALTVLLAAGLRRWDLSAAALIALGMCAGLGLEAASNPSTTLLAETLGYTMWWGSELGLWVWLVLAWALWLALAALVRLALRALARWMATRGAWPRRGAWPARGAWLPWARRAAVGLASLGGLAGVGVAGFAVAATAKPDSHVREYRPIALTAAGIERLIPPGASIDYGFGDLDLATQPIEPAIRFMLVRHGDRPMAEGSFPRLGDYYELWGRPYQWKVYLTGSPRPHPGMILASRVRFSDRWGPEVLSAWVRRIVLPRAPARRTARAQPARIGR